MDNVQKKNETVIYFSVEFWPIRLARMNKMNEWIITFMIRHWIDEMQSNL